MSKVSASAGLSNQWASKRLPPANRNNVSSDPLVESSRRFSTSTPRGMTIPVGIAAFVQEYNIRYGEMSAASFFAAIPALILVILAQRHIVKGLTLGALKG